MLNLDICDKCIRTALKFSLGINKKLIWKQGAICCPKMRWKHTSLDSVPPSVCPYKLEHAVSEVSVVRINR